MEAHFCDRLSSAIAASGVAAVVGIDPVYERLPGKLRPAQQTLAATAAATEAFCGRLIDLVASQVPAVKINVAFFEALYAPGLAAYYRLVAQAHARGLLVIGDIKRGDIGSTAERYALGHLASPRFPDVPPECIPDAVTLAGYLGENAVRPFIAAAREHGRGMFVLVRPSDPGADEVHEFGGDSPFYLHMASLVKRWGAGKELIGKCGLSCVGAVVAPKDPQSTAALRRAMPATPFLVPGYGAQGAGADACRACFLPEGRGAIINASRSVIYAFENAFYQQQHGDDWQACVGHACQDFVGDVRRMQA